MPILPPRDGTYLFSEVLDFNMKHNATQPFYVFAKDDSPTLTRITHLEFARACHRVAHALRPARDGREGQVVAIIAMVDTIVYQAATAGLILAGLVPFPISPRNSPGAIVNLLQRTGCHRLITTTGTLQSLVDDVTVYLSAADPMFELSTEEIPSLERVYPRLGTETSGDPFLPFPSPAHRPALRDLCLYEHSSGSTGFPKAIPFTQQIILQWASLLEALITELNDQESPHVLSTMAQPPFHSMALVGQLLMPIFGITSISVFPPVVTSKDALPLVPSPDLVLDHMIRTKSTCGAIVPVFLQMWSSSSKAVAYLGSLRFIAFGGGALVKKIGDGLVAAGVRLRMVYGGTEFACPAYVNPLDGDEEDWEWMRFHENVKPRWDSQGDGTFELQLLTTDKHTPSVENLPDTRGYATSDIFERHPTKKYLWKIVGRVDDVIIHSSGEKTVPGPMEEIILGSQLVQGAVMFGRERSLAGVLVELNPSYRIDVNDAQKVAELRNALWPVIEEANKNAPAFSRIFKEMILIASPDKALPRAAKGTVMRKAAIQVYNSEIATLYESVNSGTKDIQLPKEWSVEHLEKWLLQQASDIQAGKIFGPTADLFEQGFDSLSVTFLRHRIISALRSSSDRHDEEKITQNTIYSYPTIAMLSAFLAELFAHAEGSIMVKDRRTEIEEMIQKYSVGLDTTTNLGANLENPSADAPAVVLLTGSTGNLGADLLVSLLEDPKVGRVYALNRRSSTATIVERHRDKFVDKGLSEALLLCEKLVYIEGDASQLNLGLSNELYEKLRSSVTVIIHNAWRLNFNLSLAAFEPQIRGTRHLIDLARSGPYSSNLRFLFTSSVSATQNWDPKRGPFPEEVVDDAGVAIGAGYGESKYISERVLEKSGLKSTSFRIGQISGGLPNGSWSVTDWLPILIKSSVALGALPNSKGIITWISMNTVAKIILDVAFAGEQPPGALNIVHPQPVAWESMILAMRDAILQERGLNNDDLRLISFCEWFTLLEERAKRADAQDVRNMPAIKLLDFFKGIALIDVQADDEVGGISRFSTEKVQAISPTFRNANPTSSADVVTWVKYWNSVGMFD